MKDFLKKLKTNKKKFYINFILITLLTGVNAYFIYSLLLLSGIETFIRAIIIIVILLIWLLFCWFSIKNLLKDFKIKYYIFLFIKIIYILISFFISFNINKIYLKIKKVSNLYTNYSTSLVTNLDNPVSSITKIGSTKIGILNDENSIDGYQIPKEIIKTKKLSNEIVYYDNYVSLFEALSLNEIEYIFVPTNYRIMFAEIENIQETLENTKIIYTETKRIKREISKRKTAIDKPFTILLMGVDSTAEDINSGSFNGDSLMVLTFNPKTLNTTIVSIPRDSYVPIVCFNGQRKNKITHAAWYGEDCMIKTIENFLGIEIDYYVKINFKGVVKLVDALGGIEVNVPYSFCEQNSNREWGKKTVYVEEGKQTLNGEQALALSRNRHSASGSSMMAKYCPTYNKGARNDFVRGQNQQLVIKGIVDKGKGIRDISTLYTLLDTISINMETNMQTNEILSFYNVGKDIIDKSRSMNMDEIIDFQRLYISGYSATIMDYSAFNNQGMRLNLYNFIPYKGSVKDIVEAMEINLEKKPKKIIKTLKFSINTPYKEKIIGKGYYNEAGIALLPNFVDQLEIKAVEYANKHSFKININYITSKDSRHTIGQIVKQQPYANMDINYVKDITIDVVKKLEIEEIEEETEEVLIPNCSLKENKDHSLCLLPDFVSKDYSYFRNWLKKYRLSIEIKEELIIVGHPDYTIDKIGKVIYQSEKPGTSIYDLIDDSLTIRYIPLEEETNDKDKDEDEDIDLDTDEDKSITDLDEESQSDNPGEENQIDDPNIDDIIP